VNGDEQHTVVWCSDDVWCGVVSSLREVFVAAPVCVLSSRVV